MRGRWRRTRRWRGGYSAPVGLLGVTRTMARVRGVRRARAASGSGSMPGPQGRGMVSMPHMSRHILWLKYQGTGSSTASPGAARVGMAVQNAWLQPAVMATSSAGSRRRSGRWSGRRARNGGRGGRGRGRRGGCRLGADRSAMWARRSSGGGSMGAAWLRLRRGRRGEVDALEPAAGLHHRRRGGGEDVGADGGHGWVSLGEPMAGAAAAQGGGGGEERGGGEPATAGGLASAPRGGSGLGRRMRAMAEPPILTLAHLRLTSGATPCSRGWGCRASGGADRARRAQRLGQVDADEADGGDGRGRRGGAVAAAGRPASATWRRRRISAASRTRGLRRARAPGGEDWRVAAAMDGLRLERG